MEAAKMIFTSTEEQHESALMEHNECVLCGTALSFKHQVDYLKLVVQEEGSCPSCHIQLKKRDFSLQ